MSANNNREPSLSAKPLTTTPDPLSAAVEAFKFDGAREGVTYPENMRVADYERAVLSARIQAAITAYIEATGMVTAMRRARTVLAANGQAATPTNVLGALDRAMIAASPAPTVEVG